MKTEGGSPLLMQSVAGAGEALAQARRLLCEPTPRNLELCCGAMAAAQEQLRDLRRQVTESHPGDRALCVIARQLRGELDAITILLERSARYHANLLEKMLAASRPAALYVVPAPTPRLRLEA